MVRGSLGGPFRLLCAHRAGPVRRAGVTRWTAPFSTREYDVIHFIDCMWVDDAGSSRMWVLAPLLWRITSRHSMRSHSLFVFVADGGERWKPTSGNTGVAWWAVGAVGGGAALGLWPSSADCASPASAGPAWWSPARWFGWRHQPDSAFLTSIQEDPRVRRGVGVWMCVCEGDGGEGEEERVGEMGTMSFYCRHLWTP